MKLFRHLAIAVLLLAATSLSAQVQRWQNWCQNGGFKVVTQGLNSVTQVQRSFPGCTVTVFLTGTTTLAPIFSDILSTPLSNPFTANVDGSFGFFASTTACYDITISGGNAGNTIPIPFTFTDQCLGSGGGGGSVGPGTINQVSKFTAVNNVGDSSGGPDDGSHAVPWTNGLSVEQRDLEISCVNGAAGTTANLLVEPDASTNCQTASISSNKVPGVAITGAGTTGSSRVAIAGYANCVFDGTTVVGDYVVPSATAAGQCHDVGAATVAGLETVGIIKTVNGGAGTLALVNIFPGNISAPNSAGGSGTVSPCGTSGAIAYYPVPGMAISCDISFTTDGAGHWSAKSGAFTDTSFAGFYFQVQGTAPTLAAANAIYVFPPTTIASTLAWQWPGTLPTNNNCVKWAVFGSVFSPADSGAPCGTGSGTTIQVNGTPIITQSPVNFQNSSTVTFSNPSAGNIQAATANTITTGKLGTPSAPVLTTNGSAGAVSYTYAVVGCQDTACTFHTPLSNTTTIATGNATLSSSNSINLKTYGSTFYGVRGYLICRTASAGTPGTTGILTGNLGAPLIAGKQFVDTGLAGDGTNCASTFASDTTLTTPFCQVGSSLPGAGLTTSGFPCGTDGMPLIPNAFDDEFMQVFGNPGDVNNTFWTWGNQQGATATWSNGTIILVPDTLAQWEYLTHSVALPSPPYTFIVFVSVQVAAVTAGNGDGCFLGLRESGSSKIITLSILSTQPHNAQTSSGGYLLDTRNSTSNTVGGGLEFQAFNLNQGYLRIQNDGASPNNIITSFSPSGDGVAYTKELSQVVTVPFTTTPNQLIIGGTGNGGGNTTCTFDFERRTQ